MARMTRNGSTGSRHRTVLVGALAVGVVSLCIGCALVPPAANPPNAPAPEVQTAGRVRTTPDDRSTGFLGNEACVECHPEEAREHAGSNHAHTLRAARRDLLPPELKLPGTFRDPSSGVEFTLAVESSDAAGSAPGGLLFSARTPRGTQSRRVDLVLGSGKRGVTFLSLEPPNTLIELRASCFPRRNEWLITPGQQNSEPNSIGKPHPGKDGQRCMGCHSTVLPESRLTPEDRFMGVGCESCHGAGKTHVAQMAGRKQPFKITTRKQRRGRETNELCGQCHRTEQDIDPDDGVSMFQTQRFQPYGLGKSACFQASEDRLTCMTCHDPHRNVSTDTAAYEKICRSCHGSAPKQKLCTVNTRSGCVSCHMPKRELLPGIALADHWIRVFPDSANTPAKAPSRPDAEAPR
jgi:hypothetical protein